MSLLQNLQVEVEQHDLAARHLAKTGKELQDLCKGLLMIFCYIFFYGCPVICQFYMT